MNRSPARGTGCGGRWYAETTAARAYGNRRCGPDGPISGVKFRGNKLLRSDGARELRLTGESALYSRKPLRKGCRIASAALWLGRNLPLQTSVQRASGIPCASRFERSRKYLQTSGACARESVHALTLFDNQTCPNEPRDSFSSRLISRSRLRRDSRLIQNRPFS